MINTELCASLHKRRDSQNKCITNGIFLIYAIYRCGHIYLGMQSVAYLGT